MSFSKVVRLAVAIVVASILLIPLLQGVKAPPLVPYETWGVAQDTGGASLGVNQPIRTFIDGVDYSNLTGTYRADGSYQTQILGNWYIGATSETPTIKEGGDPGDPVMFAHGDMTTSGLVFRQKAGWSTATFQNVDLKEAIGTKQPALIKIYSITTRPTDLLSQYAYVCNPTASPVDLSNYFFETDTLNSFVGPRVFSLSGILGSGQRVFGDFLSTTYLTNGGDAVKLVFENPTGADSPFGGSDVVVDRVEFNASSGGALTWEPGNTIMTDAGAPGLGQEIRRTSSCADTNQGSDFTVGPETGRPTAPTVTVLSPNGGERWTGGTPHPITFTLGDAQEPNSNLPLNISYSTDSGLTYPNLIATGLFGTGSTGSTNTYNWNPVPSINNNNVRILVCAVDSTALLRCDASTNNFAIDSTRPSVTNHIPASAAIDVPVNQDIVVTFSEPMDQASAEGAFTMTAGG